jgi:hypothetical protein
VASSPKSASPEWQHEPHVANCRNKKTDIAVGITLDGSVVFAVERSVSGEKAILTK